MKTYNCFIQPVLNMKIWSKSQKISAIPPHVKKVQEGLTRLRKKEQGENNKIKIIYKRWINISYKFFITRVIIKESIVLVL